MSRGQARRRLFSLSAFYVYNGTHRQHMVQFSQRALFARSGYTLYVTIKMLCARAGTDCMKHVQA